MGGHLLRPGRTEKGFKKGTVGPGNPEGRGIQAKHIRAKKKPMHERTESVAGVEDRGVSVGCVCVCVCLVEF